MSLIGKIFAVLNILAAAGFVVVAGMDWGQRQRWAYAVYRHDLFINGLPIDAKEPEPDGTPRVNKLNDTTLAALFPGAPGDRVKTQEDEVKRVYELVMGKVNGPDVPGTKSQKLARYLLPLARDAHDRDDLLTKMAAKQEGDKAAADLQQRLDQEFAGVRDGSRSSQQRKDQAARLLFCTREALHDDPNTDFFASPAYKRFVNVVGLTGAAQAASEQALVLNAMTTETISLHDAERTRFGNDMDGIAYAAEKMAQADDRQTARLKSKEDDVAKAKALVEKRTVELDKLKKQLVKLRQTTAENLEQQARAEQEVMERLVVLRDTGKKNQELEKEIRRLEGLPPERP